ncbi:hypothetical protein FRZ44_37960 [Hypericibacter terrae]|uniref:Uncharacterized protein n=1 Tax=Hypericibacter terrae TaxID=2602015 RepID=A0A5J6MM99_9PROT|nr:hypothetical protein [Hypericibacter terrae]QEX18489.1 hypothetical protein FRZ44_37960 [Hypericibacter terrae]
MLWTPGNSFNWRTDNFGSTYTDAGLGTSVPGSGVANTKGANTALLAGIAEDCYGIAICFSGLSSSAGIRRSIVDLLIDPAAGAGNAGSSWSVAIANLYCNNPAFTLGATGQRYYFPLFLKAGTAIGAALQDVAATAAAARVCVRCFGKPTRPELLRVGTKVQTLGATTASTTGVAVTPGTSAKGSYSATLGTTSFDAWWWQLGIGSNDSSMTANSYLWDIAVNATNKIIVAQDIGYGVVGTVEQAWKDAMGCCPPMYDVASGQDVYVRAAAAAAPDSSMDAIVYALGG